jgi:hypothetical protein
MFFVLKAIPAVKLRPAGIGDFPGLSLDGLGEEA